MLEMLQQLSDDQTALLGCGVAVLGSTLLLMLSFHANPENRKKQASETLSNSGKSHKIGEKEQRRAA